MQGHEFRDYLQSFYHGLKTGCRDCRKEGVVGENLEIVYSESIGPKIFEQTVWTICEDCRKKRVSKG